MIASMDAWLHTECGLDNMQRAQYTQQELARLQLGYFVREMDQRPQSGSGADRRRRELREGQQHARDEMLSDLGFD